MTALVGIGGVLAYLLVGGIAAAVSDRMGNGSYDDDPMLRCVLIAFWPAFAAFAAICGAARLATSGAYRGGVWLVDSVADLFESRGKRLDEQAVKLAAAEVLKRRRR